jgi:hypothetical protein
MIEQMNFNDELLDFSTLKNYENLNGHKVNASTPIFLRIS